MLPRWHIVLGAIFTGILWLMAPEINKYYLLLVFLASVFIDIDHYICAVKKTGKIGLFSSLEYYENYGVEEKKRHGRGVREKGDFHFLHTIEFHVLIAILSIFWAPLFYVFIGMVFHSLLDIFDMLRAGVIYRREFFFFRWLRNKF
ncbi:hypothetical protein COU54_04440 [Candidatus Pacearchaeota archaeon CG10_big_fil_rev_8_21_14_0_10_31_24]|nr:MAG: hypothetical protein COU54_04440 [Candidatus Pacearchaeota archaeon CG10_big_fil_rev_8_21_14_0_10_31_24]